MSLSQKASDLLLLLKTQKKYQWIVGITIFMVMYLVVAGPGKKPQFANAPKVKHNEDAQKKSKTQANDEAYKDIVSAFSDQIKQLNSRLDQQVDQQKKSEQKIEEYNERTAQIFKNLIQTMQDTQSAQSTAINQMNNTDSPDPVDVGQDPGVAAGDTGASVEDNSLEQFGEMNLAEVPPPPPAGPGKIAFIGAGDSVRVKLLSGVRAPTDGTPYPVLFQLVDDVQGPDGSALPIGEARLVAAAQGSLTDSRVLFRLTKINVRLPNGRRRVLDVDGWVVGEDGVRGMQGIPIDPIGKAIAAGGMIGALGAVGEGLSRSTTSVTQDTFGNTREIITGDLGKYTAGKGASGFANEWGKIVADRVKALVPHIEVYSGREGTAIFAQNIAIRGLFEAMDDNSESDVFASAD